MPVDASIYSQLAPQQRTEGPLDQFGRALQIRSLLGQGDLQDMQITQGRLGIENQGRLRELFARGQPTPEQVGAIDPKMGMDYRKSLLESTKTQAETERAKAETFAKNIGTMRDLTAQVRGDADMPLLRDTAVRLFGPDVAAKMNIPDRFDPAWQRAQILSADELVRQIAPNYKPVALGGSTEIVQTNPLAPGAPTGPLQHTPTPAELETRRHNRATEATASGNATREALQKINQQENIMRDDFTNASKEFVKVRDAHQRVLESAKDPSAAGDLALIFNYMKVLDPGSTVREGEFATAQNSGGVDQRTLALYNNVMRGERLSPDIRIDFLTRSGKLYDGAVANQKLIEDEYAAKAVRAQARPEQVVTKFRVQERKSIDGKNYVKRDGKWHEE